MRAARVCFAALLVLCAVVAPLWNLRFFAPDMPARRADLVPVWVGARATLHRRDPYSGPTTRQIQTAYYGRPLTAADHVDKMRYVYPAHTAIVLAPLALLPWRDARLAFLLLMPLLTAASVLMWVRTLQIGAPARRLALWALLAVMSWPCVWALRLQQPTLIVAVLIAASCCLLSEGYEGSACVLLAMATIKPQFTGILIAWLVVWAVRQHAWRFVASLLTAMVCLLAAAFWLVPAWLPQWWSALTDYAHYPHSHPVLIQLFGRWAGGACMLVLAGGTVLVLWRSRRCPARSRDFGVAAALCVAIAVTLVPTYLPMIYNQVLLLPCCLLLLSMRPAQVYASIARTLALGMLVWSFVSMPIAVLGAELSHSSVFWRSLPFYNLLFPVAVTAAVALDKLTPVSTEGSAVPA